MKYGNKTLNKIADGIYQVEKKNEFYFMFKLRNKKYMINATKDYSVKNKTQAKNILDDVKSTLRQKGHKDIKIRTFEFYFKEHLEKYTSKNTLDTYNRHWEWIKSSIGHLKPTQISRDTIKDLLDTVYKNKSDTVKEKLKFILSPVFRKLVKDEIIEFNPVDRVTFPSPKTQLDPLPSRLQMPEKEMLKVAQDVFESILGVEDERGRKNKRLFYLFSIMLLRRRSEILQYTYGDIKDGYLYVKKEYTKTNEPETIPLPKEILDEIKKVKIIDPKEKLVKMHYTWASTYFKTIVKKYPQMRLHDLRSLFFIVMFQRGQSMDLLDVCLSHSIKGTRKSYLTAIAMRREDVFHDWWDVLRDNSRRDSSNQCTP